MARMQEAYFTPVAFSEGGGGAGWAGRTKIVAARRVRPFRRAPRSDMLPPDGRTGPDEDQDGTAATDSARGLGVAEPLARFAPVNRRAVHRGERGWA